MTGATRNDGGGDQRRQLGSIGRLVRLRPASCPGLSASLFLSLSLSPFLSLSLSPSPPLPLPLPLSLSPSLSLSLSLSLSHYLSIFHSDWSFLPRTECPSPADPSGAGAARPPGSDRACGGAAAPRRRTVRARRRGSRRVSVNERPVHTHHAPAYAPAPRASVGS